MPSKSSTEDPGDDGRTSRGRSRDDAARAVRFLLIKAVLFIAVPALAAVVAVTLTLR